MTDSSVDLIREILLAAGEPLTTHDIAQRTLLDLRECDRILWSLPDKFVWQPGHRWANSSSTSSPRGEENVFQGAVDTRSKALQPSEPAELRAVTLSSGLKISVSRRPLDSDSIFSIRSAGNTVYLTINSTHEIFGTFPMPFDDAVPDSSGYKGLVELLIEAWALYEDGAPGGTAQRALQDTRLLWGRRAVEVLRDGD